MLWVSLLLLLLENGKLEKTNSSYDKYTFMMALYSILCDFANCGGFPIGV